MTTQTVNSHLKVYSSQLGLQSGIQGPKCSTGGPEERFFGGKNILAPLSQQLWGNGGGVGSQKQAV